MTISIDEWRSIFPVARSYMWHVAFPDYNRGKLFPATDMTESIKSIKNESVSYGSWEFSYPNVAERGELSFTVVEMDDYPVYKYMKEWTDQIVDITTFGVALLEELAREVHLFKYKHNNSLAINPTILWVIPSGELSLSYESSKDGKLVFELTFTVVGGH